MKWLVLPLETFSPSGIRGRTIIGPDGKERKAPVTTSDLPWVVRKFLSVFSDPFIILDESSRIKTNVPMKEEDKSARTRLVKLLNRFGERCILTGTLKSKSPVNVMDQFEFLDKDYFPESMWEFAERYCVMETVFVGNARRRVQIREDTYMKVRKYLKNSYIRGGDAQLRYAKQQVFESRAIDPEKQEHIIRNKKYSPFIRQAELLRRLSPVSMVVRRKDVLDVSFDKFVTEPIMIPVEMSERGKKLTKELVDVGFTDSFALGKAPALELLLRAQDVCNGFEPIRDAGSSGPASYRPLPENPKLDALMSLLEEIDLSRNQTVVWCSRTLLLDACAEALGKEGISYVKYNGQTSAAEKAEAEARFQAGEARVFLANQASGAYGLNCLAQCGYSVFVCINDSVETYHQAQHRLLRGQLTAMKFSYHIYVKGSVEERQLSRLWAGKELLTDSNTRDVFDVA